MCPFFIFLFLFPFFLSAFVSLFSQLVLLKIIDDLVKFAIKDIYLYILTLIIIRFPGLNDFYINEVFYFMYLLLLKYIICTFYLLIYFKKMYQTTNKHVRWKTIYEFIYKLAGYEY